MPSMQWIAPRSGCNHHCNHHKPFCKNKKLIFVEKFGFEKSLNYLCTTFDARANTRVAKWGRL